MQLFQNILLLACLTSAAIAETPPALDGATGHIFKIDLNSKTFELLKETEYAPQSDIGQSRFTVHWTDKTTITQIVERKDFSHTQGSFITIFHGIDAANRKALENRQPFEARVATVLLGEKNAKGVAPDLQSVEGLFTPDQQPPQPKKVMATVPAHPDQPASPPGGKILIDGKEVPVTLRKQNSQVFIHAPITPKDLTAGFWKTTIHGKYIDGRFTIDHMEVITLDDPRISDNPNLPRVLVIGDSISMNYHDAAKSALQGIANYHRNEGNALSSEHGVNNTELWLGNYQEKGLHWDVIQFNHGLHDLKQAYDPKTDTFGPFAIPIQTYQQNLEKQIAILKKTGAKLIWCNTTPVPTDIKSQYGRRKGTPETYNNAALEIISKHPEILITDLHALVNNSPTFQPWWKTQDPHFYKPEEQQALGQAVAETIKKALENLPE